MEDPEEPHPVELDYDSYGTEVLQLEGGASAEDDVDNALVVEAAKVGINVMPPAGTAPSTTTKPATSMTSTVTTTDPASISTTTTTTTATTVAPDANPLACTSDITISSQHARTSSLLSDDSSSTGLTSRSSQEHAKHSVSQESLERAAPGRRSLSFSEYQNFVVECSEQSHSPSGPGFNFNQPARRNHRAPSIFSVSTRTSYNNLKSGIKNKLRLRKYRSSGDLSCCVACQEGFRRGKTLRALSCGHKYCDDCLRVLFNRASTSETLMPPRCCDEVVPGDIIRAVLNDEEQHQFLKAVAQFSVPWRLRIFCPNKACGQLVQKSKTINPLRPLEFECPDCRTEICTVCKGKSHCTAQCTDDWELKAVQRGADHVWKRCYGCHSLLELPSGYAFIRCPCGASLCCGCGAVWDEQTGCPNGCINPEETDQSRPVTRAEEDEEEAIQETEAAAAAAADLVEGLQLPDEQVIELTVETVDIKEDGDTLAEPPIELLLLHERHVAERDRMVIFERKMRWAMWTRHGQLKLDILDRQSKENEQIKETQARALSATEDRQVAAEMELRATLEQIQKSVLIRLKHMEAYCNALGRSPASGGPERVVTERDLRELGQQYNERDDMARLHQSRINVMRDKQAKQIERLLARQEEELEALADKHAKELEKFEKDVATDNEKFAQVFSIRKKRLNKRWALSEEIERRKLTASTGQRYTELPALEWPAGATRRAFNLESVSE